MYRFRSGRETYNWGDIFGIGADLRPGYGLDAFVHGYMENGYDVADQPGTRAETGLFPEDCDELADLMIARWERFKQQYGVHRGD